MRKASDGKSCLKWDLKLVYYEILTPYFAIVASWRINFWGDIVVFFFLNSLQNNSVWTNFSETACLETLGRNKTPKLQVSGSRYWFNCRECDCCWTVSQGRNWARFSGGHQQVLCGLGMGFASLTFKWNFLGKHISLYLLRTRERVMCLFFWSDYLWAKVIFWEQGRSMESHTQTVTWPETI